MIGIDMNLSATLYQKDERGLELRRSYMGMTAAYASRNRWSAADGSAIETVLIHVIERGLY